MRIMVIGVSAGAGKSTFARKLGEALDLSVYHLDCYYWKPDWVEASSEEFAQAQADIVSSKSSWIIEGNYTGTFDIRVEHADAIIYLELPLYVCLYRVVKRWITNQGKTRPDRADGCTEKLDWKFIHFIYTTYYPRKRKMRERFREYEKDKQVIILKNRREIDSYIRKVQKSKRVVAP
ncbi:P-loop NTPase family protein [Sutcliffiella deserti]|uniref:topology modulation protein n=1 Tax=Sutcliffiella deserti TaxID=2875501 RepID=UPI001CC11BC4|nr:topology modulation protein [Sutcliffiella deserti]